MRFSQHHKTAHSKRYKKLGQQLRSVQKNEDKLNQTLKKYHFLKKRPVSS
jgi:hypothetical protein